MGSRLRSSRRWRTAREVDAPGPLRVEHDHLIEVLQLRASGSQPACRRLPADCDRSKREPRPDGSSPTRRRLLVASDVNWDFYFKEPTQRELAEPEHPRHRRRARLEHLFEPRSREHGGDDGRLAAVHGAATGGDARRRPRQRPRVRHGPSRQQAARSGGAASDNEITASTDLAFQVVVEDSGDFQEFNVRVTLTIQKSPRPIVLRKKIDVINAGETKTVTFTDIDINGLFGLPTTLKVDVAPVPGEKTTSNNSAEYRVIFSLGG